MPTWRASSVWLGATNADLGRMFEVDERTIGQWIADRPEFSHAVKAGREVADPLHGKIFEGISALVDRGQVVNVLT
jgi:hypothetical protein